MKNTLILLLFTPLLAFGQNTKGSKFALDVLYSPDVYIPASLAADASFDQVSAYRYGFNLIKSNENTPVSFKTGIRYAVYNQRIEGISFDTSRFFLPNISFRKITYYEIPFAVRYSVGKNKLRGYAECLLNVNLGGNVANLKTHVSWGLSVGLEYSIVDQLAIFAQPIFRKSSSQNNVFVLSSGLEMGVKFKFGSF